MRFQLVCERRLSHLLSISPADQKIATPTLFWSATTAFTDCSIRPRRWPRSCANVVRAASIPFHPSSLSCGAPS